MGHFRAVVAPETLVVGVELRLRVEAVELLVVNGQQHAIGAGEEVVVVHAFEVLVPLHEAKAFGAGDEELRDLVEDGETIDHGASRLHWFAAVGEDRLLDLNRVIAYLRRRWTSWLGVERQNDILHCRVEIMRVRLPCVTPKQRQTAKSCAQGVCAKAPLVRVQIPEASTVPAATWKY